MQLWNFPVRAIAFSVCFGTSYAEFPLSCAYDYSHLRDVCWKQLEDITIIEPGEALVATVPCHGCPTIVFVGEGPSRKHISTHEENSLLYNVSLSSSRTQLLLNSVPIFPDFIPPTPAIRPPDIYAAQIRPNYSVSDLAAAIECTKPRRGSLTGGCFDASGSLGSMGLSYEYTVAEAGGEKGVWEVRFDAVGGLESFLGDLYTVLDAPGQRVLALTVRRAARDGTLEIIGAELEDRARQPGPVEGERNWQALWEKVLYFFGLKENEVEPGRVVYLRYRWDMYGRTGTLRHMLRVIRGEWPWELLSVIFGSVFGGLLVLYALYWLIVVHYPQILKGWDRKLMFEVDEENRPKETAGLLDGMDVDDDADMDGGEEDIEAATPEVVSTAKSLPRTPSQDKSLPPMPPP